MEQSQHMQALARANEVRSVRHRVKRQIATGELSVIRLLTEPLAPELENMPLTELLMAQHRWGRTRCRRLCRSLVISELRPLGALTVRERDRIVGLLRYSSQGEIEWAA